MESVCIATKANGDIMVVGSDAKGLKNHLRKIGHHPHKDHTNQMIWYDFRNEFVCYLRIYDVANF